MPGKSTMAFIAVSLALTGLSAALWGAACDITRLSERADDTYLSAAAFTGVIAAMFWIALWRAWRLEQLLKGNTSKLLDRALTDRSALIRTLGEVVPGQRQRALRATMPQRRVL